MAHYQATIEYDGTDFHGFQRQRGVRTVQAVLEAEVGRLQGGAPVQVRGAGRTDSGVHATGQVIAFELRWRKDEAALHHALTTQLPEDVTVRQLARCSERFHPRYDALSRRYRYTILNTPHRQALLRRTTLHEPQPLDERAMDEAARRLVGEHDFATFGRPMREGGPTVRRMIAARVARDGDLIHIELEANAFLFRMVRSLVGALIPIGRGEQSPAWMAELLAARDRTLVPPVVAPQGLCLVAVRYEWGSPEADRSLETN